MWTLFFYTCLTFSFSTNTGCGFHPMATFTTRELCFETLETVQKLKPYDKALCSPGTPVVREVQP